MFPSKPLPERAAGMRRGMNMRQRNSLFLLLAGALILGMAAAVSATARAQSASGGDAAKSDTAKSDTAPKATARDYGVTGSAPPKDDPLLLGAFVFSQRCSVCHSKRAGGKTDYGPHLAGLYGRKAGATGWDGHTDALKDSGVVWDEKTLNQLVSDPQSLAPGVKMNTIVRFKRSRTALMQYLKTL